MHRPQPTSIGMQSDCDFFDRVRSHEERAVPSPLNLSIASAIAAALIVFGVYRKSVKRARPDPRLELDAETNALRRAIDALVVQLEAEKLRMGAIASPQWLSAWEADLSEARLIYARLQAEDFEHRDLSPLAHEMQLFEILNSAVRVNQIADKYRHAAATEDTTLEPLDQQAIFES